MFSGIEGFIFDLDDTIVESEKINIRLINDYFQFTLKIHLDKEDQQIVFGHSWRDIYQILIKKYKLNIMIDDIQEGVLRRKKRFLGKNVLRLATGIRKVLDLPPKKVIVSGSGRGEIEMVLENVNLKDTFDAIFSVDDYIVGKPMPDGYLMALEYLKLDPQKVLGFEDSRSGIQSAQRAGIAAIFIREFANTNCASLADSSFENFEEFHRAFIQG
jgi:beta-phosphoglucomutase